MVVLLSTRHGQSFTVRDIDVSIRIYGRPECFRPTELPNSLEIPEVGAAQYAGCQGKKFDERCVRQSGTAFDKCSRVLPEFPTMQHPTK